jgi:hypothetical protein
MINTRVPEVQRGFCDPIDLILGESVCLQAAARLHAGRASTQSAPVPDTPPWSRDS